MFTKALTIFCVAAISFLVMECSALLQKAPWRELPDRVLIGYGSNIDRVRTAVHDGVNVVIWAFLDVVAAPSCSTALKNQLSQEGAMPNQTTIATSLNLTAVQALVEELDETGYDHVFHLVSFGGWNGPHLDPKLSAVDWYLGFRQHVGHLFHGLDWDLEGNDKLTSPYNLFTTECLDKMVSISRMAKADGYVVSMAPPQSYLDILGRSCFSRLVNLSDPKRQWHTQFSYFGANVYAYLLAKSSESVDLISIQFYESYSRAAEAVKRNGVSPSKYLEHYVTNLVKSDLMHYVDFSKDTELDMPGSFIAVPLSKLVFGFANGWALHDTEKNFFATIDEVQEAWNTLETNHHLPRGFMFWTIDEEGKNGVNMAKGLSRILNGAKPRERPLESA